MSPIERQLTMVIDARRRDMARMFVALFVAMSMMFSLAAGVTGPAQVVMAAEAPAGEAGLDDAVQEESVDEPAAGADEGEPEGGFDEGEDPSEPSDGEAGNDEGEDPSEPSDGEAGNDEGTDEEPSFLLMGGHGGGGGNGTVVIHKFGKGVAGNEFPLNGARFKVEREKEVCGWILFPIWWDCWDEWKPYKTVTDNGKDDHDKDAPGVIELRLPAGKYRISEDRAPDGYTKSSAKFEVDVKAGKSYGPFKFVNQLKITKPAIIIKKYADENNNGKIDKHDTLLGGVTFKVEHLVPSGSNWVVNKSFHVTDNGPDDDDPTPGVILLNKVSLKGSSNQYRVTEIPPEGWVALTPQITKDVKSSSQATFEFLNQRAPEPDLEPDLSVVKTLIDPESGVATVGDEVRFEITVENTGEVDLEDIQVTDNFDTAYLQFVGIDEVNDEQVNGSEISWTIPGLAKGASVTYTARFIAKAATGPEGTTSRVKVEAGDLVDEADDTVEIVEGEPGPEPEPKADLVISKYGENNDELLAGAAFRITGDGVKIDIEDNQDNEDGKDWDPEPGVIRVKGLQPGQYQVQETRAPTGYRIKPEPEQVDVTCDQPVEPTLLVHDAEDSPCGEAVVVFFNEREDDDTPPPSRTPRNPRVDLSVTKTVDDPTPDEGQLVTFTVTVTNEGPDDASGVVVSDILPAGLEYVSHSASQGSYDPASGQWVVGNLADDASATLTVFAAVGEGTAGRTLVNTARIISSNPDDRNLSNNTATAEVTPPEPILIEEEPPLAEPPADPPLPVTGGSMALLLIPGITLLGAGLYVRRRYLR